MTPLDLRKAPPRPPLAKLDGLLFLPRTIDKARASLPGGALGEYALTGFSEMLFAKIHVDQARFVDIVRTSEDDEDVAAWLRSHADTTAYNAWNEWLLSRVITDEAHQKRIYARYPVAAENPEMRRIVDILDADDRASFPMIQEVRRRS